MYGGGGINEIAEIIVSINSRQVDRRFHYAVPPALRDIVRVGMRALVPFGKGNRLQEGFILGLTDTTDTPPESLKSIGELPDAEPLFTPETLALAEWMRQKYGATMSDCLHCIMPAGIALRNKFAAVLREKADGFGLKGKMRTVFDYVASHGGIVAQRELDEQFGTAVARTLQALRDGGHLDLKQDYELRDYTVRVKYAFLNDDNPDLESLLDEALAKKDKQASVLETLLDRGGMAVADLRGFLHISPSPILTLARNGLLRLETVERLRNVTNRAAEEQAITLTGEQESAIAAISDMLSAPERKPVLIRGVTGSGKTEIYMRVIEQAITQGKQAIMLVPEIALTPQTIEVFTNRFGDAVTFTHSRLSLGERFDQWKKARDGRVSVMIGPRSAIFTPFAKLGVIVVDEEHESTYKSENTPKYDAREVAAELSRLTGCLVLMGSATPDVCSMYRAETGEYALVTLKERVNRRMPDIFVADMRYELADGNRSVFSRALREAMESNLAAGEQTILFLNRRGHSTFVSCRACGHVLACEACSVNYTYHLHTGKMLCHYCGKQIKAPSNCPVCGNKHIRFFGVGTQKLEEELERLFPAARVLRMDMDTTSRKHSHARIIKAFADKEADILVGTQMIAKGLNFPGVTLVGIVAADIALNMGDYRAAETAYQLITQVSGRAGRAALPGRVFIQTYDPEHYSIEFAKQQDYERFYAHEIAIRREMSYPPFAHLAVVLMTCGDERKLIKTLQFLADIMSTVNRKKLFEILGPSPAVISKLRNTYRWKLLLKGEDEALLRQFIQYCMEQLHKHAETSGVTAAVSVNPANIP